MAYDFTTGVLRFELDVMLSADTDRPKHTDVLEQGMFLSNWLASALRGLGGLDGAAFGNLRLVDEHGSVLWEGATGDQQ